MARYFLDNSGYFCRINSVDFCDVSRLDDTNIAFIKVINCRYNKLDIPL